MKRFDAGGFHKLFPNQAATIQGMRKSTTAAGLAALAVTIGAGLQPIAASADNSASGLTPSAVIANSRGYDGQMITVTGTVASLQPEVKKLHADFEQYQLCNGEAADKWCVTVIELGRSALQEGQQTTASGMYRADFHRGDVEMSNILIVKGTSKAH